jgi:hypothetical protein
VRVEKVQDGRTQVLAMEEESSKEGSPLKEQEQIKYLNFLPPSVVRKAYDIRRGEECGQLQE